MAKSKRITVRLNDEELAIVDGRGARDFGGRASFLRFLLRADIFALWLDEDEPVPDYRYLDAVSVKVLARELTRQGVQINKAARALNSLARLVSQKKAATIDWNSYCGIAERSLRDARVNLEVAADRVEGLVRRAGYGRAPAAGAKPTEFHHLTFRAGADELALADERAQALGIGRSEFIRFLIRADVLAPLLDDGRELPGVYIYADFETANALVREVHRQRNNLNQASRALAALEAWDAYGRYCSEAERAASACRAALCRIAGAAAVIAEHTGHDRRRGKHADA